jgi:hypothetical protein
MHNGRRQNGAGPVRRIGVPLNLQEWAAQPLVWYARLLARYHRHRVLHLERLGRLMAAGRRVVLVGNHARDITDPMLFTMALAERYGCIPRFVGHEILVFEFPVLGDVAKRYRMIPSRRMDEAAAALRRDGLLMIFPGSGTEAVMRSYRREPYRLKWEGRFGFLRLALENDAEIAFVAAVGIDEMYYQTDVVAPRWMLRSFGAERYLGATYEFGLLGPHLLPTVFPLPVQITHVVSRPLALRDRAAAGRSPAALERLHRQVWTSCQRFLDRAVAAQRRTAPPLDRVVRAGERWLQRLGV